MMNVFRGMYVIAFVALLIPYGTARADYDVADHDVQNVRTILEDDPQYQWTGLHWAVRRGNMEEVKSEIDRGARIDARDFLERTPLHIAVLSGHLEIVEHLIDEGADVNAKDEWGVTPLRRLELLKEARGWDRSEIRALLEEHGGTE